MSSQNISFFKARGKSYTGNKAQLYLILFLFKYVMKYFQVEVFSGRFKEAHHLQPLGHPFNGAYTLNNLFFCLININLIYKFDYILAGAPAKLILGLRHRPLKAAKA